MALPPSVPTSFVPYAASSAVRRFRTDFSDIFKFFAYIILGVVVALAIGLFFYDRILASEKAAKDAKLADEVQKIDPTVVEGFIRLRNRLTEGSALLDKHLAFSSFFSVLEGLMPSTIRFSSLHFTLDDKGIVNLSGAGTAKSFNALAATSLAFAGEGRIKNAIFSNIAIGKAGSVSFVLSASLDPKLVVFSPSISVSNTSTSSSAASSTPSL